MKKFPILLVLIITMFNIALTMFVVDKVQAKPPKDFTLYQVSIQKPNKELPQVIFGKPSRLFMPTIGIDLSVADGEYNSVSREWTLSKDKAHYALLTPEPNNTSGNTFIYGHNNKNVFAKLSSITVGDKISLFTESGKEFVYQYTESRQVEPTDTSLFSYQGSPILTIQTCSGTWYEKRSLYTFVFVEVK